MTRPVAAGASLMPGCKHGACDALRRIVFAYVVGTWLRHDDFADAGSTDIGNVGSGKPAALGDPAPRGKLQRMRQDRAFAFFRR